jgi:hypothetical protein
LVVWCKNLLLGDVKAWISVVVWAHHSVDDWCTVTMDSWIKWLNPCWCWKDFNDMADGLHHRDGKVMTASLTSI